jgi:hypothetical protein
MGTLRQYIRQRIEREEWHPIQECPPYPLDERTRLLERNLAVLWDMVWWLSLPFYRRWFYRWLGYQAPIPRFYVETWREGKK